MLIVSGLYSQYTASASRMFELRIELRYRHWMFLG